MCFKTLKIHEHRSGIQRKFEKHTFWEKAKNKPEFYFYMSYSLIMQNPSLYNFRVRHGNPPLSKSLEPSGSILKPFSSLHLAASSQLSATTSLKWISSVQPLSRVWLFGTPWNAACQASLSITNSQSLLKLVSIESVMPSNHLILCHPLLLVPSIFPSIRVFSNESVLRIRWPKYWSFSFNMSPYSEYSGLISFRMDWLDLLAVTDFIFLDSKITADGNWSHEIKRHLLLGRKVMTNLDSLLKIKALLCQQRSV